MNERHPSNGPVSPIRRTSLDTLLFLVWVMLTGGGMALLWTYSSRPGASGEPPPAWPPTSTLERAKDRPTLVMFAHPRCPCTRATMGELARLMTQCRDQVSAHVRFYEPEGAEASWTQTDLWRSAAAIPGVSVGRDPGGAEAVRFGSSTSGNVVLYDPSGHLRFHGGITAARGHHGDNAGRSGIVALLNGELMGRVETPVFGCSLVLPVEASADANLTWTP